MSYYLKGIGDSQKNINEILPVFDARISNFLINEKYGVITTELNKFNARVTDRSVIVDNGMMLAYGYFGYSDTQTQINYVMPQSIQYANIYAEINLSVTPNTFSIRTTMPSNDNNYIPKQDNLLDNTSGIFRLWLYQVELTSSTITLTDKRNYIGCVKNATYAWNYVQGGVIDDALKDRQPKMKLLASNIEISPASNGTVTKEFIPNYNVNNGDILLANIHVTRPRNKFFSGLFCISDEAFSCITNNELVDLSNGNPGVYGYQCDFKMRWNDKTSCNIICFSGHEVRTTDQYTAYDTTYTLDSLYKLN